MHYSLSFLYTRVHRDLSTIPRNVKLLVASLFVYFLAWGVIDPFISIFIYSIVQSYTLTGLLYGLYFLTGVLLAVPIGGLADKINKLQFTTRTMLVYPFIGLLYFMLPFLAPVLAFAALLVARVAHGAASLFWVMAEGFIRKNAPKGQTSATFGLYITFNKLCYVVAPIIVVPAVIFFGLTISSLNWLFLLVLPFPILAALIISRIKQREENEESLVQGIEDVIVKDKVFVKELRDFSSLGAAGYVGMLLGFFMRSLQTIIFFLLPLYALSLNLGLMELSILIAIVNLPFLLSFFLAELSDYFGKANMIALGFVAAGLFLLAISLTPAASTAFFIICFGLGLVLALLQPAVNGLITDITPRVNDGEMTGMFFATLKISGFFSVLALGILSDLFGLQFPFMLFALLLIAVAGITYSIKSKIVVRI